MSGSADWCTILVPGVATCGSIEFNLKSDMDRPVMIGAWLAIRDLIAWGHPIHSSGNQASLAGIARVAVSFLEGCDLLLTRVCYRNNPRRVKTINNGYPCYGSSHDFSPSRYLVFPFPLAAFCSWPRYGGCYRGPQSPPRVGIRDACNSQNEGKN